MRVSFFGANNRCSFFRSSNLRARIYLCAQKFDGLLGFSQGAMAAAILAAIKESKQPSSHMLESLRFVLLFSGGPPRAESLIDLFRSPLQTPSIHVWGEADEILRPELSAMLADRFSVETRHEYQHRGGHVIPTDADSRTRVTAFLRTVSRKLPNTDCASNQDGIINKSQAAL